MSKKFSEHLKNQTQRSRIVIFPRKNAVEVLPTKKDFGKSFLKHSGNCERIFVETIYRSRICNA